MIDKISMDLIIMGEDIGLDLSYMASRDVMECGIYLRHSIQSVINRSN